MGHIRPIRIQDENHRLIDRATIGRYNELNIIHRKGHLDSEIWIDVIIYL